MGRVMACRAETLKALYMYIYSIAMEEALAQCVRRNKKNATREKSLSRVLSSLRYNQTRYCSLSLSGSGANPHELFT